MKAKLLTASLLLSLGIAYAQEEPGAATVTASAPEASAPVVAEPQMTDGVLEPEAPTVVTDKTIEMSEVMNEYLMKKGWEPTGENYKPDGSVFLVRTGWFGNDADPKADPKTFMRARSNAFQIALLMAKSEMVKYLGATIAFSASYSSKTDDGGLGNPLQEALGEAMANLENAEFQQANASDALAKEMARMPADSEIGRMQQFLSDETDRLFREKCRAMGEDPNEILELLRRQREEAEARVGDLQAQSAAAQAQTADAQRKLEKVQKICAAVVEDAQYSRIITLAARHMVSGIQAYKTFESADGKAIGVIVLWSPDLANLSSLIASGTNQGALPRKTPKKKISQQLPKDSTELLGTFGTRTMIDDRGEITLVAFAQEPVTGSSSMAQRNAETAAKLNAEAEIRIFAGEFASVDQTLQDRQFMQRLDIEAIPDTEAISQVNGEVLTKANRTAQENYKSAGGPLTARGIGSNTLKTLVHPLSGKKVVVAYATWKPSGAKVAGKISSKANETATQGAIGNNVLPTESSEGLTPQKPRKAPAPIKAVNGIYSGAEGDDDAF